MAKAERPRLTPNVENADQVNQLRREVEEKEQELAAKEEELEQQTKEIERIADLQQSLLPHDLPAIPGMALAASQEAPRKAGGDYFDIFPLGKHPDGSVNRDGRWLILVADGMGHEPASAVVTAMLNGILHAFPGSPNDPAQVLEFLNRQMCSKNLGEWFATAVVALLDPAQRTLRFASAGHPPPLLKDSDGADITELSSAQSLPLGVQHESAFTSDQVVLEPGTIVLLYTDGAVEATDERGEQFGMERFKQTLANADGAAAAIVKGLNHAIASHRQGRPQADDTTLVALQVLNSPRRAS